MNEKFNWVELTNPRSEREFDFLVREVGEEKIIEARSLLCGRRAFPLNLARILRVQLPEQLQFLPTVEAKEKIQDLRRRLRRAGGGVGVQSEGMGTGLVPEHTHHSGVTGGEDDHA